MTRSLAALVLAVALPAGALAQEQVSPQALNDCTALTDPARLQQCILAAQGAPRIRGRLTSRKPPPPDAPLFRDSETPTRTVKPFPDPP